MPYFFFFELLAAGFAAYFLSQVLMPNQVYGRQNPKMAVASNKTVRIYHHALYNQPRYAKNKAKITLITLSRVPTLHFIALPLLNFGIKEYIKLRNIFGFFEKFVIKW